MYWPTAIYYLVVNNLTLKKEIFELKLKTSQILAIW